MSPAVTTVELFLIAMTVIFTVPFLIWRFGRTDYYAPLVVVQIISGIVLGPGVLGRLFPGAAVLFGYLQVGKGRLPVFNEAETSRRSRPPVLCPATERGESPERITAEIPRR